MAIESDITDRKNAEAETAHATRSLLHGAPQCLLVLQRLLADLVLPIVLRSGETVSVGSSIGVARWPVDGAAADDLMLRADRAMFESKRAGRCGIRFHAAVSTPPTPQAEPARHARLEGEGEAADATALMKA